MKNAILKEIQKKIETNEEEYASMYIVEKFQLSLETPDEVELNKARLNMKQTEERIAWLKELLQKESSA